SPAGCVGRGRRTGGRRLFDRIDGPGGRRGGPGRCLLAGPRGGRGGPPPPNPSDGPPGRAGSPGPGRTPPPSRRPPPHPRRPAGRAPPTPPRKRRSPPAALIALMQAADRVWVVDSPTDKSPVPEPVEVLKGMSPPAPGYSFAFKAPALKDLPREGHRWVVFL